MDPGALDYCYLSTTGRVSGEPHEIEIWFALADGVAYMLSGGGDRSDWVKNLRANPAVTIRIGDERRAAVARVVVDMYDGDAARLWTEAATGADLVKRVMALQVIADLHPEFRLQLDSVIKPLREHLERLDVPLVRRG